MTADSQSLRLLLEGAPPREKIHGNTTRKSGCREIVWDVERPQRLLGSF
jgi:hypothetical protein